MSGPVEIRGGASEFEAAVIAVVVDHARNEEKARASGRRHDPRLPAWVRAMRPDLYPDRIEQARPK